MRTYGLGELAASGTRGILTHDAHAAESATLTPNP